MKIEESDGLDETKTCDGFEVVIVGSWRATACGPSIVWSDNVVFPRGC